MKNVIKSLVLTLCHILGKLALYSIPSESSAIHIHTSGVYLVLTCQGFAYIYIVTVFS